MIAPADPIQTFVDYYHDYNAISPQRRVMQIRVLRHLEAHLPVPVLEMEAEHLRAWVASLVRDGLHPNTVRQYLMAAKPLIRWMWEGRLINAEQMLEFRAVGPPRGANAHGVPRPYSPKELERFWRQVNELYPWARDLNTRPRGEHYVERWRKGQSRWNRIQPYAKRLQLEAIIALALFGALRRDEIFNLRLDELHPDNEYIVVRSRKNREGVEIVRTVPWLSPEMREAVRAWLEFRAELGPEHDHVWLSLHNEVHHLKVMSHRTFGWIMTALGEGWELHRMRHTAATVMLRSGMPLDKVSLILGHTRLEQTRRYAQVTDMDIVAAAALTADKFSRAFARERNAA